MDLKSKNLKISVIMPVYNAEKYLRQCIESILGQTLEELELICIDDCSTDNSFSILEEYASKDSRITVLKNDVNHYAGYCRNRGIELAKGEYLHFIDSDDYMISDAYETLYNIAKENDLDMIKAKSKGIDTATSIYVPNPLYDLSKISADKFGIIMNFYDYPKTFMSVAVTPWNGIYKRDFVISNNLSFNGLKCVNDRSFYISAILKADKIMLSDYCMICHRVNNPESLIGQRAKNFDCHFNSFNIIYNLCKNSLPKVKYIILRYEMNDLCAWFNKFKNEYFLDLYPEMKNFLNTVDIHDIMINDYEKEKSNWYKTCSDIIKLSVSDYINKNKITILEKKLYSENTLFAERSAVIYVKNNYNCIKQCIEQIKSDVKTEYIFTDDGSVDGSVEFLIDYAMNNQNVIVFLMNNAGIEQCKKTAFYSATGKKREFYLAEQFSDNYTDDETEKHDVKVSVVVPCYNVSQYIRECLDSLIYQTLKEIEIICVNDGSTDNTLDILKEYASFDSRVKIIDKPNSGYGNTMNMGMQAAHGEYIGILESDDYVMVDMYESLYLEAVNNNLDFVKADFYRFFHENKKLELFYNSITNNKKEYYNKIMRPRDVLESFRFVMNTWSGIYKRSFIEANNIHHNETPGASFQDNGFWFQTFALAERAMFINKPYYMNRRDNPNSSVHDKGKVYAVQYEYDRIREFINANDEKLHHLIPIIWYKKYRNYMFTYNRIGEEYKEDFLENFSKEFHEAENSGELDTTLFGKSELIKLQNIMSDHAEFYMTDFKERMSSEKQAYNFGKAITDKNSDNISPKVSVIMPVYNIENYIRQALDSVVRQTLSDIEIICIDDGSTDATLSIIEEYAEKDDRFIVIKQHNSGAGNARNKGLDIAKGECLSFLDGDDFFEYDLLETVYNKMQKTKADIAVYQVNAFNNDTKETSYCKIGYREEYIPKKDVFSYHDMPKYIFNAFQNWPWNKMFRRSFIQRNNITFQPLFRTNDLLFTCTALVSASRITKIERPLVTYRRQSDNSSQATNHIAPLDFYKAFCALKDKLTELEILNELEQSFVNSALKGCIYNLGSLKSGEAFKTLYLMLKNEGFKNLNISYHTKGYYYDKKAFGEYEKIKDTDLSDYLFDKLSWNRDILFEKQLDFNEKIQADSQKINSMEVIIHSMQQRTANINDHIDNSENEYKNQIEKISENLEIKNAELEKREADIKNGYYELHYKESMIYSNPKITLILPVYNNEAEIRSRLDSVISQSLPELEIICINLNSSDDSLAVLTDMHRLDKRIKILNLSADNSKSGYNMALNEAHGQYIMILPADTRLYNNDICAFMYKNISDNSADIYEGKIQYTENGVILSNTDKETKYNVFDGSYAQNALSSLIINRKLISENKLSFSEFGILDDYSFFIKIMNTASKIYAVNDIVCCAVKDKFSLTNTDEAETFINSVISILRYTKENNLTVWNSNVYKLMSIQYADDIYSLMNGRSSVLMNLILEAYSYTFENSKDNNYILEKLILETREKYDVFSLKNDTYEKQCRDFENLQEQFEKVKEISKEKSIKIEDIIHQMSEIKKENKICIIKYNQANDERNMAVSEKISLENKLQELTNVKHELHDITDKLNRMKEKYLTLENDNSSLNNKINSLNEKNNLLNNKNKQLDTEKSKLLKQIDELNKKLKDEKFKSDNANKKAENALKQAKENKANTEKVKNELIICQSNLECTRNAFSHRLGMAMTALPRKIKNIFRKN